MTRPDPGAVPGRAHHISSIAHLYLQDEPPAVRDDPRMAACSCAIASPGESPISAFAASGLLHGLPGPAVLFEEHRLRWSVNSFPGPENGGLRLVDHPGQSGLKRWRVAEGSDPSWSPEEDSGAGTRPEIRWHHLGCLDADRLAHLESLSAIRGFGYDPLLGIAELFWCVLAGEAGRFGSAYTLGRVVEFLRPGSLQILVFPDAWSRAGLPGWLEDIATGSSGPADGNSLLQFREAAECVCAGVPVRIRAVTGSDNLTGAFDLQENGNSLWGRMARRAAGLL